MLILDGKYLIPASSATVWRAINDPVVLQQSVGRGCEGVEQVSAEEFLIGARMRIGPLSSRFDLRLLLCEVQVPERYSLRGEGRGGLAEAAHGHADVALTQHARGTVLQYNACIHLGNRLADLALPLVRGAARRLSDRFFSRFAASVLARERMGEL